MRKFIPLLAVVLLVGCSSVKVDKNPDPVDVTGRVTLGGQPVSDVTLTLMATGAGAQANIPVKNGELKGKVMPGKYTYFVSEGNPKALQSIPQKYREGSMDRQIDVAAGSVLNITLD